MKLNVDGNGKSESRPLQPRYRGCRDAGPGEHPLEEGQHWGHPDRGYSHGQTFQGFSTRDEKVSREERLQAFQRRRF